MGRRTLVPVLFMAVLILAGAGCAAPPEDPLLPPGTCVTGGGIPLYYVGPPDTFANTYIMSDTSDYRLCLGGPAGFVTTLVKADTWDEAAAKCLAASLPNAPTAPRHLIEEGWNAPPWVWLCY